VKRSYWSGPVREFLGTDPRAILGSLSVAHSFDITDLQKNAWTYEIDFLRSELLHLPEAYILLEYFIPRMGKRIDSILITGGLIFLLEFKIGAESYLRHDITQVIDYALDLKYFHGESQAVSLIPVLMASAAPSVGNTPIVYPDRVWAPLKVNPATFSPTIAEALSTDYGPPINPRVWESASYNPTPTIVEAAQVLYEGHNVADIARSDAANITITTDAVSRIIERAKAESRKAICFITGVPGSGKTLAGLNLATQRRNPDTDEHAVFLSGNGPLVQVLQEALARSDVANGGSASKGEALAKTKAFIQLIHHFRDESLMSDTPPPEKVVIFDEAQRAWTRAHLKKFMAQKKGVSDFAYSEPAFLLDVMNRHADWAVLVCLIGGGQEINTGEAGLPEWFHAIGTHFSNWDIYVGYAPQNRDMI